MKIIANTEKHNYAQEIKSLLVWAESCYLCTSFIDKQGVELLLPALMEASKKHDFKVSIYSNGEHKYTKPWVVKTLNKLTYVNHLVVKPDGRRLHSKIYLFVNGSQYIAIIGSANLTGNGLVNNEELSLKYSGDTDSDQFLELFQYLSSLAR
ncbi:phospholipase D-like domain-containing protein [Vibrio parahaemolyticus]|uniref:phospholipase D-like domain-containing protein n=1 Tax=Vibrio parahaemolyticus TaxID=670 RepID=UPI00211A5679|nr:phospholipase D family protein [Vibrio parahaemolyticus]MCQ9100235.1 NgoFVII family restriction endonuclease [Vibrio parahaemolyticus]